MYHLIKIELADVFSRSKPAKKHPDRLLLKELNYVIKMRHLEKGFI